MFAEEQPALGPLPLEPFRYYRFGERTVHLDGCVEVEAAYYGAPPGWIGQRVQVQWNDLHVRLLAPKTGQLLREHLRDARGWHRIHDDDRPARTPASHGRAARPRDDGRPAHWAPSARRSTSTKAPPAVRRMLGVLALAKKHGPAVVDDAAKAALDIGVPTYRFLRRVSRTPPARAADAPPGRPAHSSAHALSRSHRSQNRRPRMNLVELDHALRKLRLSGMAAVLETRLRHAQTEKLTPIDLVATLVVRRTPAPPGPPARAPAQTGAAFAIPTLPRQL